MKTPADWLHEAFVMAEKQVLTLWVEENPSLLREGIEENRVLISTLFAVQLSTPPGMLTVGLSNFEKDALGVQKEMERLITDIMQAQMFNTPTVDRDSWMPT